VQLFIDLCCACCVLTLIACHWCGICSVLLCC
jgi:hypothetical protein